MLRKLKKNQKKTIPVSKQKKINFVADFSIPDEVSKYFKALAHSICSSKLAKNHSKDFFLILTIRVFNQGILIKEIFIQNHLQNK